MKYGYDEVTDHFLNSTPEKINEYLIIQDSQISDEESMLYAMKFYRLYPNTPITSIRLFNILFRLKNYEVAYLIAKRGMEKFPDNYEMYQIYSKVIHLFKNKNEQMSFAERWHNKFSDRIPSAIYYSKILFDNDEIDKAESILIPLMKGVNRYNISLTRTIASFYRNQKNFEQAESVLKEAYYNTDNLHIGIDLLSLYVAKKSFTQIESLVEEFILRPDAYNALELYSVFVKILYILEQLPEHRRYMLCKKVIYFLCMEKYVKSNFPIQKPRALLWVFLTSFGKLDYLIPVIKNFLINSPAYSITMFPHRNVFFNLDMIDIPFLNNVIKYPIAIQKLTNFINNNQNKIVLNDSYIYYCLFFAVVTNNNVLKENIIRNAQNNRENLNNFILQIIDKWSKNSNSPEQAHHIPRASLSDQTSKPSRKFKIAVCVAGQLRGFEKAFASWKKTFYLEDCDTDIYVSTWKNVGCALPKLEQKTRSLPLNFYRVLQKNYNNFNDFAYYYPSIRKQFDEETFITFNKLKKIYNTDHIIIEDDSIYPFNSFNNNLKKFYYKIFTLRKIISSSYDIIILLRPDLFISSKLDKNNVFDMYNDCIHNNIAYDRIGVLPDLGFTIGIDDALTFSRFDIMYEYFKVFSDEISNKEHYGYINNPFRAHYARYQFFFRNGIEIKKISKIETSYLDAILLSSILIKKIMLHDISLRQETNIDRELLHALEVDIEIEKSNTYSIQPQV